MGSIAPRRSGREGNTRPHCSDKDFLVGPVRRFLGRLDSAQPSLPSIRLMQTLALEDTDCNIRVNCIAPIGWNAHAQRS